MRYRHILTLCTAMASLLGGGCGVNKATHRQTVHELQAVNARLDQSESERSQQATRIRELEQELQAARRDFERSEAERRSLEQQLDAANTRVSETRAYAETLRREFDGLLNARPVKGKGKQAARIAELEAELAQTRVKLQSRTAAIERLLEQERRRIQLLEKQGIRPIR